MNELQERIMRLKKDKNYLILAHYYQTLDIQDIADHVGDSFALAELAQKADCDGIIMCGVRFMAESAKLLSPGKKVFLPVAEAGCPMADMITPEDVKALRRAHTKAAAVCYVNSSAAVKAVCDVCCTSSSAERIVRALPEKEVIFVPDRNLGSYIAQQVPEKKIILFNGCCPVHDKITAEMARLAKEKQPNALLAVHPECRAEVVGYADYVGSTAGILDFVRKSGHDEFIIGTEIGVLEILRRELPEKKIALITEEFTCEDMKKTRLEDVLRCLEGEIAPIELERNEMLNAAVSLERMVAL